MTLASSAPLVGTLLLRNGRLKVPALPNKCF
jgi:hypothetical protein